MPDERGFLSDEEQERFARFLSEKVKIAGCESCGKNEWARGGQLVCAPVFAKNMLLGSVGVIPFVYIQCMNCGNIRYHSALLVGIVEKEAG